VAAAAAVVVVDVVPQGLAMTLKITDLVVLDKDADILTNISDYLFIYVELFNLQNKFNYNLLSFFTASSLILNCFARPFAV